MKMFLATIARHLLARPATTSNRLIRQRLAKSAFMNPNRNFTTTRPQAATYNQVLRHCRKPRAAAKKRSPALTNRPEMAGVCLRVGTTKPKKPNSGERKTCRVRLSNGKQVTAYIPGEGHNVQQHSVVLLRGGRAQDCPGVRYKCVRGAHDLGGVPSRQTSRSKYGTKKPKSLQA